MIQNDMQEIGRVLLTFVVIMAAYAAPFFHLRRWKALDSTEAAALAPGAASLLFGAAAFATHAIGLDQPSIHALVFALLALSILPYAGRGEKGSSMRWKPALYGLLFLALILTLQASFPIYIGGFWYFDWWQHYNLAQMYLGKTPHDYLWLGIYNFASRTPLMNLNAAFFLSFLGDSYWVYQLVASVLNSAVMLPAYLLVRRISGGKVAMAAMALLFLSPSFVHNTWYPWPKLFATYFVLLAAHFYLRFEDATDNDGAMALIFALIWAGFLAHQSSLFSSGVILLAIALKALKREPRNLLRLGMICAACFILINGIWFGWAASFFGIKRTFLSYYERPATVGGVSGYLILFTYHTLATLCSPLFAYDLVGKISDPLRPYQNIQVLYYNSLAGMATITAFCATLVVLCRVVVRGSGEPSYAQFARRPIIYRLVALLSAWLFMMALLILALPGFGGALFSRFFNHPQFARWMFTGFFAAGSLSLGVAAGVLWKTGRKDSIAPGWPLFSGASLLFWMVLAGYAGGIATHHELYIHGMVSAGSATAVFLTILFFARVCSDLSRPARLLLAVPIFIENFMISWAPLFIIRNRWGWSDEKNWQLKTENALIFLADLFPEKWRWAMLAGLAAQAVMLFVWIVVDTRERERENRTEA
jgi:hypothetical protein